MTPNAGHNTKESAERYTPRYLFEALDTRFDLDVCAPAQHVPSKEFCARFYSLELGQDATLLPFDGYVWLNPPYGKSTAKARLMRKMALHRNGLALVPAYYSDSDYLQDNQPDGIYILADRVRFVYPEDVYSKIGTGSSAFPCWLLAYGPRALVDLQTLHANQNLHGFLLETVSPRLPSVEQATFLNSPVAGEGVLA